jgi:hypothetical protein
MDEEDRIGGGCHGVPAQRSYPFDPTSFDKVKGLCRAT